MGDPFKVYKKRGKQNFAQDEIKIEVAKQTLIDWLKASEFDFVTIIPFSSKVEKKLSGSLSKNITKIRNFIYKQIGDGDTNLQAALSLGMKIANEANDSYMQFLIVTDGLSHTVEEDLRLVQVLPSTLSITGILIDPTTEGEEHLRKLCIRGSYLSVSGKKELVKVLKNQNNIHAKRIKLSKSIKNLASKSNQTIKNLETIEQNIETFPKIYKKLEKIIVDSHGAGQAINEKKELLTNQIVDQNILFPEIEKEYQALESQLTDLDSMVKLLKEYDFLLRQLKISICHPRFFAKGFKSAFFINIHPIDKKIRELNRQFRAIGKSNKLFNTVLVTDLMVTVNLSGSIIGIPDEITKKLLSGQNNFHFSVIPNKNMAENQNAIINVFNKKTKTVYESQTFETKILDFSVGKLSLPILLVISAGIIGLFATIIYVLGILNIIATVSGSLISLLLGVIALTILVIHIRYFKVCNVVQYF